ncbi:hypothetical protein C7S15_7110 [Burkholderia cepacia]|nr:hypothetical protein [Burkholderia cepacia]
MRLLAVRCGGAGRSRVAARMKKPAGRLARAGGRRHLGPTGAGVA